MKIINQKMSARKFINYLNGLKIRPWTRKIDRIIMHHTSSPVESWQNSGSMLHYWNLYRSRGWKAGPHIFIAPNGIWMFTDLLKKGKCSLDELNDGSIHIEIVGRYFDGPPQNGEINYLSSLVVSAILEKFNIKPLNIYTHYEFDSESNCSPHVGLPWLNSQFETYKEIINKNLYENSNQ